jgi:small subunit ribosomal protein S8
MVTDPIADLLTRIRNANQVGHLELDVPHSNIKNEVVSILKKEGFIKGSKEYNDKLCPKKKLIKVYLKYENETERVIKGIKRISKPGRRVYVNKEQIPSVLGGLGLAIISTSKGLLTDKEAKMQNIGGEVLCYVW